jgi:hypothetical protein
MEGKITQSKHLRKFPSDKIFLPSLRSSEASGGWHDRKGSGGGGCRKGRRGQMMIPEGGKKKSNYQGVEWARKRRWQIFGDAGKAGKDNDNDLTAAGKEVWARSEGRIRGFEKLFVSFLSKAASWVTFD